MDLITESSYGLFGGEEALDDFSDELPEATREEAVAGCEAQAENRSEPDETLSDATLVSDDGSRAVVTATLLPADGDEYDVDLQLVEENGTWKIDLVSSIESMTGSLETDTTLPED